MRDGGDEEEERVGESEGGGDEDEGGRVMREKEGDPLIASRGHPRLNNNQPLLKQTLHHSQSQVTLRPQLGTPPGPPKHPG